MNAEKNIKIFVSHRIDLDSKIIDNEIFVPVRCGAVFDKRDNQRIIGDDTGNNVSSHRETFCELTVLYWAWKNIDADYYGLCHYRRYMNFSDTVFPEDCFGNVVMDKLNDSNMEKCMLQNTETIKEKLNNVDYAYTDFDVTKAGHKNVYEQYYNTINSLKKWEIDLAVELIKDKSPHMLKYAKKYLKGTHFYPCLMFVMNRKLFNEFCEWLFPLLFELEKRMDDQYRSLEERRNPAHLAERMFGIFITYVKEKYPDLQGKKFQRVLFLNTNNINDIRPLEEDAVPIVMASSDYYTPYLSVAMKSILQSRKESKFFDFIILNTDISEKNKYLIKSDLDDYDLFSIRFVDVNYLISDINLSFGHLPHISKESFYRLLIPEICKHYHKVIFLDSDVIVQDDLTHLYDTDLKGNAIGAVVDVDFVGEYRIDFMNMQKYCKNVLGLKNPYNYFQCGVLIFDLDVMSSIDKDKYALLSMANGKFYKYVDQDILNSKYEGHIFHLELNWNVYSDCYNVRIKEFISNGPAVYYKKYMEARKAPKIIHYAGGEKPWIFPMMDYATEYYHVARTSLYYEEIILRMTRMYTNVPKMSLVRRIADKFFPKGSNRREYLKKIMPRGSKQFETLKKIYHSIALD